MKRAFLTGRCRKILRSYSKEIREAAGHAITEVQSAFGDPHRHAGLGIRKLSRQHFEVRVHLDIRLVFTEEAGGLAFDFAGTHDEVQRFLKAMR